MLDSQITGNIFYTLEKRTYLSIGLSSIPSPSILDLDRHTLTHKKHINGTP